MFTILLGKTASGKTTILEELVKKHNKKKIITYTTRPIRPGEINGESYHFISVDEFENKVKNGFFLEYKKYETATGIWWYGSAAEDYENADADTVIILTPNGYMDFLSSFKDKQHLSIYVYANNETIKRRLAIRGDTKTEAERRLMKDNNDFKGIEKIVNKVVYNNIHTDIHDPVNRILEYMDRGD